MSMRFNRFYNKLSKKNSKINLASYDDKLISSVPAEELDLPNGYTISDNKIYYNDNKIGDFSYRNINSSSVSDDIDLDDIDIISNKEDSLDIDLDNINIPDKEDSLDIDLDNINIPDKEDPLDIDLDNINIPDKEDPLDVDLDSINIIPSKATKVPKAIFNDENELDMDNNKKDEEKFTTEEQKELLEKIHDVQEGLRKSFLEYESNKKDLTEDYVKQIEGYKTRFNDLQQEIVFESKKETIEQLNELNLMKKQVDNVNGRIRFKLNNVNNDAKKDSKKTTSALDRIKSVKKEDKEQEEEKRIELIKEYADLFDQNQKLVLVCRALYDYLVESGEDKEYDSLKRRYFVLLDLSRYSIEGIENMIKDAKYNNERLCEMIDNARAKQEAEKAKKTENEEVKAKKTENEEVKAKKALIAKSLVKDMKDIITKEAKVVGMRALAFTLKQVADIKKAAEEKFVEIKTSVPEKKYRTALDKIRAKKEQEAVKQEASDIVKELKEKTEEPKMVVPEFLRIIKKEEKVEKVEPEVKPEPVVVEETITTKTDVNFNTLNERIYDKYSISDLKELDSKIEKNNSKLEKTNEKIDKKEKKILEAEVGLELAIKNSDLESELVYRKKIEDLKSKLEELKDKAESLKFKIASRKDVVNRFKEQSIVVYEQNLAEENRIMQEKEDAMNARLEKEAIEERDNTRKDISKVFRKAEDGELSALNYKNNNEIKKLLKYTSQLEEEGKDPKEFLKKYAEALEAEKKASDNLKELEMAMGLVKEDKKKTAKRK